MIRRKASALFLVGCLVSWLLTSDAISATATLPDMTDFITRLGGYLFPVAGPSDKAIYWLQLSYSVAAPATPSNITTITMTKLPMASVFKGSGTGLPAVQPTTLTPTTPTVTLLNACNVLNYSVEKVTLDLRDIQLITPAPTQSTDGGNKVWAVVLQTSNKANLIRKNTQTLPATCSVSLPGQAQPDSKMEQTDVSEYPILFADLTQANRFVKLLNNVIPTLNPPVLIETAPAQ